MSPPHSPVPGLGAALIVTLVVSAVAVPAAALLGGRPQVLGTLLGVGLVAGFFVVGSVLVGLVTVHAPRASLLVALTTYTLQVVLLAAVFAGVSRAGLLEETLDGRWVAGVVVVATLAWVLALVVHALRSGEDHIVH